MNRQMEDYQYIVNYQARKIHRRIPAYARNFIAIEDMEQEGWIAFLRACREFDESYNVKFTSFLTTNLILALGNYVAHTLAKQRLPLGDVLPLEEMPSGTHTNGFKQGFLSYTDPQFSVIDMKLSLQSVLGKIPKRYAFFVEWLLRTDKSDITSIGKVCRELHVSRYKLRTASKLIMKHLYA